MNEKVETRLAEEIDYETFERKFWPRMRSNERLTPMQAWTEIFSVIKGSANSCQFINNYLPEDKYT